MARNGTDRENEQEAEVVADAGTLTASHGGDSEPICPADARTRDPAAFGDTLPSEAVKTDDLDELRTIDRADYHVHGELARGGMGRILHARDRRHGRPVAIKELLGSSFALQARFRREALITARLQHPSIVPVYEAGKWPSGEPFYAMKKVEGQPLNEVIAGRTTLAERLSLLPTVIAVADALAYAHERRIIHRDLKPANVLVGSFGETVVLDWGLAKDLSAAQVAAAPRNEASRGREPHDALTGDLPTLSVAPEEVPREVPSWSDDGLTVAGHAMGTPAYMPPEQARGEMVDERADVYAIGALLFHVLAGEMPYAEAAGAGDVIATVVAGPPAPLRSLQPDAPADLIAIVEKATARDRDDRYPSAAELAADLRRFETGQLVSVREYSLSVLARRWMRRHRTGIVGAAIAVIGLLIVGGFSIHRVVQARDTADRMRAAAEDSRARAEAALATAEQMRGVAEDERERAQQAAESAERQRQIAEEERQEAIRQKLEAEAAREQAESSREEAGRQRAAALRQQEATRKAEIKARAVGADPGVAGIVRDYYEDAKTCTDEAFADDPNLRKLRVLLSIRVGDFGFVDRVTSESQFPEVDACLESMARRWRFPKGNKKNYEIPVTFERE